LSRYPQGQPVRVSTTVKDVTGALVDAGTLTLVVKLIAADGTQTTTGTYSSPAHDGTGLYHQDVPATDLTALGHYIYVWTSTGTGAGVSPPGDFDVYDSYELTAAAKDYCTPEELKSRLQITSSADDDQIDAAVTAASRAIDGYCERYFYRITDTRTYVPADLYRTRVDDLVSVTTLATDPAGTTPQGGTFPVTWPAGSFQLLPYNPGKIGEPWPYTAIRAVGGLTFPWVIPLLLMRMDRVQVTGVFGWPAIPAAVHTAALITASELFRMKHIPRGGDFAAEVVVTVIRGNPAVQQLLDPYNRAPFLAA
jgi:hypothetical protein